MSRRSVTPSFYPSHFPLSPLSLSLSLSLSLLSLPLLLSLPPPSLSPSGKHVVPLDSMPVVWNQDSGIKEGGKVYEYAIVLARRDKAAKLTVIFDDAGGERERGRE